MSFHETQYDGWQGILLYGMEGKIDMEYGMTQVWNGMENLMYGMEKIFHIPYRFHTCIF